MILRTLFVLTICVFGLVSEAGAHAMGQSYVYLRIFDDAVTGRFEVPVTTLNLDVGLTLPTDMTATEVEVAAHADAARAYLMKQVSMSVNGVSTPIRFVENGFFETSFAQYAVYEFELDRVPGKPTTMDIRYEVGFDHEPEHRGLLCIEHHWRAGTIDNESEVSLIFHPGSRTQTLDLTNTSIWRGFGALVGLGIYHIRVGLDHILFLLALLLPAVLRREDGHWVGVPKFKDALFSVLKIVTLFTLAHTITLSLAALGVVKLPSQLVESIIAISIAIAALDVLVPIFHGRVWIVVFVFGLFHGFGFASVLGEKGISSAYIVPSLLGFNVGVELGQAMIVLAIMPVLFLMRKWRVYHRVLVPLGAVGLIAISIFWFCERGFGIHLPGGNIVKILENMLT